MVALLDTHCGLYMAQTSDNLARQHGITREADGRVRAAQPAGAPRPRRARGVFTRGDRPGRRRRRAARPCASRRTTTCGPETTLEGLAALKPAFGKDGFVTAGNASGIVDGAAALVVAARDEAQRRGLKPLARIVAWGVAGVPPEIMGIGPVPASRKALEAAGLVARRTSTWSRSTRRSPASTWRSRRSSASTASGPTSTAARSRSAIRWAPPARACC